MPKRIKAAEGAESPDAKKLNVSGKQQEKSGQPAGHEQFGSQMHNLLSLEKDKKASELIIEAKK